MESEKCSAGCHEGSALFVALVIMGILLTLSLGVSELLLGALRDRQNLQDVARAWYAAESGIERALFAISANAPGHEERLENQQIGEAKYSYEVRAAGKNIPDTTADAALSAAESFADLALNESVIIPLFNGEAVSAVGAAQGVKKFRLDYYVPRGIVAAGNAVLEDIDILRWKIFGIAPDGKMEVLNEFSPLQNDKNSAENPSCVGVATDCWNAVKKYFARMPSGEIEIKPGYLMSIFLDTHTQNFLVISNNINTDLLTQGSLTEDELNGAAKIRYRFSALDDGEVKATLPFITVRADGRAGSAVQSLNARIKRETFLPVFNYALYRTAE